MTVKITTAESNTSGAAADRVAHPFLRVEIVEKYKEIIVEVLTGWG